MSNSCRRGGGPWVAVMGIAAAAVAAAPSPLRVVAGDRARRADARYVAFVQSPVSPGRSAGAEISNTILAGRYLAGARVVIAELGDVAGTRRVLTPDFVCAADPVFNHDGTRLAFCGQRAPEDRLSIWEVTVDDWASAASGREGRGVAPPREIVSCDSDCVSPAYLPDGRIVFASLSADEYEEHGKWYSFSLYAAAPGQSPPERLTFNPSSDFDPVVLPDGRIVYSSWQHVGNHRWPLGTIALMLVNSDGTGLFPLTGNHRDPWLKYGARPIGGDRIAFVAAGWSSSSGIGAEAGGSLVTTSLNDAFAPYRVLVRADDHDVRSVAPGPNGRLVVSAKPIARPAAGAAGAAGDAVVDSGAVRPAGGGTSADSFGLYTYGEGAPALLFDDPAYDELSPAVALGAGRPELRVSTVVPDTPFGYLMILNCEETDRTDQHRLSAGSVKMVRVLEGMPLRHHGSQGPTFVSVPGRENEAFVHPASATGYIPTRILGEVPPASDGSVYLKVPADRPLRLQVVDREGFTIVNERAWFWVRPNERRVCIGCHENRELAPSNATPLAGRRAPTDLTDPAAWRTVTFRKDIQPILTTTCAVAGCHVPPTPTAGQNLSDRLNGDKDAVLADRFGPAYANLLLRQSHKPFGIGGRRVHPGDARSSPLLWMLYGRALAPQYKPAPFERPMISAHPGPMLPEAQLQRFREWVDLGAPFDDASVPGPWPYRVRPAELVKANHDGK